MPQEAVSFGRGLNSIRVRFTLLIGACVALGSVTIAGWYVNVVPDLPEGSLQFPLILVLLLTAACCMVTYLMTGKLTRPIENLRTSTLAIARGDYNAAVEVECSCEVGGLADSFKAMVHRLNDNVTRIQTLAYEDGVTGLPNRAVLLEALERMRNCGGGLFFIDLDNFKQVNDLHGHEIGDQLLREAALRIQKVGLSIVPARAADCLLRLERGPDGDEGCRMLFRFAGDEFVALAGGMVERTELAAIAGQIIGSLRAPFQIGERSLSVGCSVGIAVLGEDTHSPGDLTKLADLAMYDAKSRGKCTYSFFETDMLTASMERAQLQSDLSLAFERHEFLLHFQPKIDVRSGRLAGVEALVRWQHPGRGMLFPGQFMDLLQEKRWMDLLGMEVVHLSIQQLKIWNQRGFDIPVAVNVCPSQLLNPDFSSNLSAICAGSGVDPRSIVLEITETVAMSGNDTVLRQLEALERGGFSIAIDDFGVGYSNLSKLYQLPFSDLKLDKSMIDRIDTDDAARSVVEYTIGMAHGLGHKVVAEGVERADQMRVLSQLGCDFVQGYLICRPSPAEALDGYFDRLSLAA